MTKRSPINDRHEALGAKVADFGGWLMPIEYPGDGGGVLAEHAAVRDAVGLFDVSHLGKAGVRGPGARDFVNRCLTNDLARIGPGQAQYTFCCADDGGVIDDLIAYLVSEDEVFLVPNAANTAAVVARLTAGAAETSVAVTNEHEQFGVLAVQGPAAAAVLAALGLPADLPYMGYADAEFAGERVRVCRTGYTGELGYELIPAWAGTGALWDAALVAVRAEGGRAAGLGARDTLRTEMGYPLHGQDLSPTITPVQARSGWAVGWDKPAFWGREALVAERAAGPARSLWGIESLGRGIPRPHMAVLAGNGADSADSADSAESGKATPIGEVTSGTFSPTLKRGIGLALLDSAAGVGAGDEVVLDVRGRHYPVRVVKPPFVPSHVR